MRWFTRVLRLKLGNSAKTTEEQLNRLNPKLLFFQILRAIAKTMNFSTNLYETEDAAREKWGSESPNGNYTGILGEMVKQQDKLVTFRPFNSLLRLLGYIL